MNLFVLHESPDEAAKAHCGKHVPKMALEAFQVANSGLHNASLEEYAFYGAGYDNHPWSVFAGESFDHFNFVRKWAHALGREFLRRNGSRHLSHEKSLQHWTHDVLSQIESEMGRASDADRLLAEAPQAMLDQYKQDDTIQAYRDYYRNEKMTKSWFLFEDVAPPKWLVQETPRERWQS